VNWAAVQQRKNKIVLKHTKGLDFLMRKNKVTTVQGYGRLTGLRQRADGGGLYRGGGAAGENTFVKAKNVIVARSEAKMLQDSKPTRAC
jgi:dihydrolipoamide dehydrogenase